MLCEYVCGICVWVLCLLHVFFMLYECAWCVCHESVYCLLVSVVIWEYMHCVHGVCYVFHVCCVACMFVYELSLVLCTSVRSVCCMSMLCPLYLLYAV